MSISLPAFNLNGVAVGSGGSIDLSEVMGGGGVNGTPGSKLPTVRLHNDSGSGLLVMLPKSGSSFNLPAGGWQDCQPGAGETQIAFTVLYVLPDPPVTLLMSAYYAPGEPVPPMTVLGNSPVGVGGTVNTNVTSTQSIVNTTNAPGSQWIDVQPTDAATATVSADNSGNLTWKGDNAGVLTTLLQLIAGASPAVKIAAASIIAEVLGGLKVDGTFESVGNATMDGTLTVTGNALLSNGKLGTATAGDIIDASGADTSLKVRGATNAIHLQSPAGTDVATFAYNQITFNQGLQMANGHIIQFNIGQIKDLNTGTALSGTINHGLTGTPAAVLATCDSASSSATTGAYSYTTTQFGLTVGSSLNARWVAYR